MRLVKNSRGKVKGLSLTVWHFYDFLWNYKGQAKEIKPLQRDRRRANGKIVQGEQERSRRIRQIEKRKGTTKWQ